MVLLGINVTQLFLSIILLNYCTTFHAMRLILNHHFCTLYNICNLKTMLANIFSNCTVVPNILCSDTELSYFCGPCQTVVARSVHQVWTPEVLLANSFPCLVVRSYQRCIVLPLLIDYQILCGVLYPCEWPTPMGQQVRVQVDTMTPTGWPMSFTRCSGT